MAVAHSMVSYVPGSAARRLHEIAPRLIGVDAALLALALSIYSQLRAGELSEAVIHNSGHGM